jgi:hypothetical protein
MGSVRITAGILNTEEECEKAAAILSDVLSAALKKARSSSAPVSTPVAQ